MEFYSFIFLLLIIIFLGIAFWIYKIFKLFQQRKTRIAIVNTSVLAILAFTICWELRLIPLAVDLDFRNQTQELTGKRFWCWNNYRYDEIGIRGEGFTFEIYELNNEMASYFTKPDKDFFLFYPTNRFEATKWRKTPVVETDIIDFVTPIYGTWSQGLQSEIQERQKLVKEISKEGGSYYSIRTTHGTDLYLISPKKRVIIYINHNM
jgi:hypothetical protein